MRYEMASAISSLVTSERLEDQGLISAAYPYQLAASKAHSKHQFLRLL